MGFYDQVGIYVYDGFIKGKLFFEKRIYVLIKRKLKCNFRFVGFNRNKEFSNLKMKLNENNFQLDGVEEVIFVYIIEIN